jgi:carbon-monoxide dehydrogenase small subunit
MPDMIVRLTVNGTRRSVEVDGPESLLHTLRERLGLPGTKNACEQGECGSCTVLLDGEPACSCLVMAADADGADVVTVEGLTGPGGALHPVQEALLAAGAVQCGFCTPGVAVSAARLLAANPRPTADEVREALAGNLCRCTGYGAIVRALAAPTEETP